MRHPTQAACPVPQDFAGSGSDVCMVWSGARMTTAMHWDDTTHLVLPRPPPLSNLVRSVMAVVTQPLASILGDFTEEVSAHTNQTLGGLIQATLGNAVEIVVAIQALYANQIRVVQVK